MEIKYLKNVPLLPMSANRYGTSYKALMDVLEAGRWCILDIDVQGVQQVTCRAGN